MAEEEKEETQQVEEKPKRNFLKLIVGAILGVILLAILGGLGYLGYQMNQMTKVVSALSSGQFTPQTQQKSQEENQEEQNKATKKEIMVHLDPFVVNLLDEEGRRYLKVTIDLSVSSEDVSKEIEDRLAEVRDQIIICLSDKSFKEICDQAGKMHLREEIKRKLNSLLASGQVMKVLFTEFVVQ